MLHCGSQTRGATSERLKSIGGTIVCAAERLKLVSLEGGKEMHGVLRWRSLRKMLVEGMDTVLVVSAVVNALQWAKWQQSQSENDPLYSTAEGSC